jgi:dihydropteroate synthase
MPIPWLPDLGHRTLVMGILNVTPDSFSDGGRFDGFGAAMAQAARMAAEGADILDVGGESTRPGHAPVSVDEEIARAVPVVEALAANGDRPVSIDTYKAATAEAALRAGARMVNDVWGLQRDPDIASVAAAHGASVILMHNRTDIDPALDIMADMMRWFERSLAIARAAGIPNDHIVLDPGVGFGKTVAQNLDAIAGVPALKSLGFPVMMGTSRKSLIGHLTGQPVPADRLHGTIASNAAAILLGADIVRVHDVGPHVEAARVVEAIREHLK